MPNGRHRNRFVLGLMVLSCFMLLSMQAHGDQNIYVSKAQNMTFSVVSVLQSGVGRIVLPVRDAFGTIQEFGSLRHEKKRLLAENLKLQDGQRQLKELRDENKRLSELVGYIGTHEFEYVPARVVARSVNEWQSAVTIDKGSYDGVKENMAVVDGYGLVGRTASVTGHAAKVLLITDRRCVVGVKVLQGEEFGMIEGAGTSGIPIRYLDRTAKVQEGDDVVTSGLGGVFPGGIMIGKVSSVVRPKLSIEKKVIIEPTVDLAKLNQVLVITTSPPIPADFREEN